MTTVSNFTAYLGKMVNFSYVPHTSFPFLDVFYHVKGKITAVCIDLDLSESEFLVNGEFYKFADVQFFEVLPNPC
ncbi:hypothetical protein [Moraxella bovis]|uniref:hypothetical protein n=1 Tax=Moraxella bovis TaxID=476 RepID=UPI002227CDD6|nr:hypothetical protein [Moraxella bovis]UYZ93666.1 hypothetical protein LP103_14100 [Moraxella bovis]UZA15401.1 hypothetical protein LP102_12775 [Moraxella bovis]